MAKRNILVAHGGGPTAVINSSLQGVIEAARASDGVGKIYAARFGAEGILKKDLIDLTDVPAETVSLLSVTPATAIGSCRRKIGEKDYPALMECFKQWCVILVKEYDNLFPRFPEGPGNQSYQHPSGCLFLWITAVYFLVRL